MGAAPFPGMARAPDHASPRGPGPSSSPADRRTTRRGELQRCHSTHAGSHAASWRENKEVSELADAQAGDELFGLPPEEFVAARDDLARRLRHEGEPEAAKQVKVLRRPPLSAWAVNQLARRPGEGLGPLLAAGERLRAAHQAALAGEGAAELRAAAKDERDAVAGLVRSAMELLGEAGHPTTDATRDRVAATLHAAAASPEAAAQVGSGRITADLDPAGFGALPDGAFEGEETAAGRGGAGAATGRRGAGTTAGRAAGRGGRAGVEPAAEGNGDRGAAAVDEAAARRARRAVAVAARDDARKRARLAADQAVLATRHAERLGRLADQAEREAGRARATAAAAIEAAGAARERAARAARELREAEDRIPADR